MFLCMDDVFKVRVVVNSKTGQNIQPTDPYELRKNATLRNISAQQLLTEFSFYILYILRLRVKHSIETQTIDGEKMSSLYRRLSPKYKKFNKRNEGRFWKDTEWLLNNMRVWQVYNTTYFGIPKHIKHPNSKTPAYEIFKYLEFGTKNPDGSVRIPARPVILPHLNFILKNIKVYFDSYLVNREKYLRR